MVLLMGLINKGPSLDDRSFAILMTTYIDSLFSIALEKTFVGMKDDIQNDLFRSEGGALSTLNKKSSIAYALGVIDANLLETTRGIRKVRNTFAHSLADIDFNHPAVSDVCMNFRIGDLDEQTEQRLLQTGYDKSTSRGRFFFGCRSVFGHVLNYTSAFGDFHGGPTRFRAKEFSPDELTRSKIESDTVAED